MKFKQPILHVFYAVAGNFIGGIIYSVTSGQDFDWGRTAVFGLFFGFLSLFFPGWKRK